MAGAGVPAGLRARAEAWMARDPDPETRAELAELLREGETAALEARFAGRLAFGTAGLRGAMAAGPARMNRVVVRESAAGIARHLRDHVPGAAERGVAIAFDARRRSERFARDCAEVIGAHGIRALIGDGPLPTPVGVFAIRRLGCAAGIVITASHNPAGDNGLKLYLGDGAQIVPPVDALVAEAIAAVAADGAVEPPGAGRRAAEPLPDAVLHDYRAAALARVPPPAAPVRIATTATHGVGGALLGELLAAAGHADVHAVGAQEEPDPDFPTVVSPNPELPGVTAMLAARMEETGAVLGLALDPDADRVAVLVPDRDGTPRRLTGDEVGALLADWLLEAVTSGPDRLVTSSVVSSGLTARIAAHRGARHAETPTGFKWLCRPAIDHPEWTQVLAYEEAIGYAVGPDARDKDGLTAALAVASMAAWEAAEGRALTDRLDDLHRRHGAHVTGDFTLRDEAPGGPERRAALVGRLLADPPARIGPEVVAAVSEPAPGVARLDLERGLRALVRPSGTEPILKCYCEAVEPVGADGPAAARARARRRLARLRAALEPLLPA
jgi:phosphomannomutase